MKKNIRHPLVIGTAVLTLTGFVTRIIGFFYRIYLSRLFGEEGMGIYQLVNPVLSLSFSLTAAGYQTAISKFVAERAAREKSSSFRPVFAGLSISLPLSVICGAGVYFLSDPIAVHMLLEARTASMLRILAFSIPLSAVHSCINGYFYGRKKTFVPAITQLIEQITRVACVYLLSAQAVLRGESPSLNVAVFGLTVGELVSMAISVLSFYRCLAARRRESRRQIPGCPAQPSQGTFVLRRSPSRAYSARRFPGSLLPVYQSILGMALPLTANRIVLNLLQSVESVSIPTALKAYGYDTATALSVYGVLTGMAMPFIFFPNAITGSVAVLLLPIISENYALGNMKAVKDAALRTVKYCFLLGFLCMGVFALFGGWAGRSLFDSPLAGHFIRTLSFLCPFLYLDTTLSSILQGLGMAGRIFLMNVASLGLRLAFVFLAIPLFGITGYLWGILCSQILLSILYLICLYRFVRRRS